MVQVDKLYPQQENVTLWFTAASSVKRNMCIDVGDYEDKQIHVDRRMDIMGHILDTS